MSRVSCVGQAARVICSRMSCTGNTMSLVAGILVAMRLRVHAQHSLVLDAVLGSSPDTSNDRLVVTSAGHPTC